MKLVHFTFNNFFDYSIIVKQIQIKSKWIFNPNEFILTFPYDFMSDYVIEYIEDLSNPLNIQFATTLEVIEDIE